MTKYYVDAQGDYLGGFDGAEPPKDSIEILEPPNHGTDKLINNVWVPSKEFINETAKQKIDDIERKSLRAMREALLTNDKTALIAIEAEIVVERDKLTKDNTKVK